MTSGDPGNRDAGGCDPTGGRVPLARCCRSSSLDSTFHLHSVAHSIANPHRVGESSNLDARNSGSPVDTNIRPPRNNPGLVHWDGPVSRGGAAAHQCEFPPRIALNQFPQSKSMLLTAFSFLVLLIVTAGLQVLCARSYPRSKSVTIRGQSVSRVSGRGNKWRWAVKPSRRR